MRNAKSRGQATSSQKVRVAKRPASASGDSGIRKTSTVSLGHQFRKTNSARKPRKTLCKKPAASIDVQQHMHITRSACGDDQIYKRPSTASARSASGDDPIYKRPSTASARSAFGDDQIYKRPSTASARTWSQTRVQLYGCRVGCCMEKHAELQQTMKELRSSRANWTVTSWNAAVKRDIASIDWGYGNHGGYRHGQQGGKRESSQAEKTPPVHGGNQDTPLGQPLADVGVSASASGEQDDTAGHVQSHGGLAAAASGERDDTPGHVHSHENSAAAASGAVLPFVLPPVVLNCTSTSGTYLRKKTPKLAGYTIHEHIGGGTYGDVYKATWKDKEASETLAIKVLHKQGKCVRASEDTIREIAILKHLAGEFHTIRLNAWRETHFNTQLIMPHYPHDLRQYMAGSGLTRHVAQIFSNNLLLAARYLRENSVLHRDIKPPNILVQLQPLAVVLADFGAARYVLPHATESGMSSGVCTLWYRAPETLLTPSQYHFPSDLWSVGVSMAEMEVGHPPFRANSQVGILFAICRGLGTPSPEDWVSLGLQRKGFTGVMGQALLPEFPKLSKLPWGHIFGADFRDLITQILKMLPTSRPTPEAALKASWFA